LIARGQGDLRERPSTHADGIRTNPLESATRLWPRTAASDMQSSVKTVMPGVPLVPFGLRFWQKQIRFVSTKVHSAQIHLSVSS